MIRYPLAMDTLSQEAIEAGVKVLRSGRYTMGEQVKEFERGFAAWVCSKHAVMVNSGSSANLLMVDALLARNGGSLNPGDGILVPAVGWATTVAPLIQLGLRPVFCDVDLPTLQMDLRMAKRLLRERPKALIAVHLTGKANDMHAISAFCTENNLILLEDACESFGAFSGKHHVGTVGIIGSHSLFFSHQLSTIEGGVITTNDDGIADVLRTLRAHGWTRDRSDKEEYALGHPGLDSRFLFALPGYNVRPTEIQGAIGVRQLVQARGMINARRETANVIASFLHGNKNLSLMNLSDAITGDVSHSWMFAPLECSGNRTKMQILLESSGVETRSLISGNLLRHPAFHNYGRPSDHPNAEHVHNHCLAIGCHPQPTQEMIATLNNAFRSVNSNAA